MLKFFFKYTGLYILLILGAALLISLMASIQVNQHQLGYELANLEIKKEKLEKQKKLLTLELETLENPKRLIQIAQQKLNLDLPKDKQIFRSF